MHMNAAAGHSNGLYSPVPDSGKAAVDDIAQGPQVHFKLEKKCTLHSLMTVQTTFKSIQKRLHVNGLYDANLHR